MTCEDQVENAQRQMYGRFLDPFSLAWLRFGLLASSSCLRQPARAQLRAMHLPTVVDASAPAAAADATPSAAPMAQ